MAIEISKTFVIDVPRAAAWAFLTDPNRVARCLPGAAITDKVDDRTYAGTITVKVGPVTASYKGKVRFEKLDAESGTAEIVGSGQDVRGKGGADMRLTSRMTEIAPGRTEVVATSLVNVTGILAQFGRGMIQDVSDQMFEKFTEAMRVELSAESGPRDGSPSASAGGSPDLASAGASPPPPNAPLDVVSLGAGAARRAAGRAVRRPVFWIVVAVLAFIVWRVFSR